MLSQRACSFALGDLDNDEDVDAADFAAFADCMAGPELPFPIGCECADLDADCDADMVDLSALQSVFTGP